MHSALVVQGVPFPPSIPLLEEELELTAPPAPPAPPIPPMPAAPLELLDEAVVSPPIPPIPLDEDVDEPLVVPTGTVPVSSRPHAAKTKPPVRRTKSPDKKGVESSCLMR
jgi:hypothetical protein